MDKDMDPTNLTRGTYLLPTHNVGVELPKNRRYSTRNPISQLLTRNFMRQFASLLQQSHPHNLLDAGCGEGVVLRQVQVLVQDSRLYGIDIDNELILVSREIVRGVSISRASITNLPYLSESFDLVICTEVLEHLEEPSEALTELSRVSANHLILSVPNEPWWRVANISRGRYWPHFGNTPGHLKHWTKSQFCNFISKYMHIVEIRNPFPWTMVLGKVR